MCAPLAVVPLIAGIAGAASTAVGTIAKVQQSNMQAAVADQNAAAERQAAAQDQTSMNQAALVKGQQIGQAEGEQRAVQAANGVNVDFGSAASTVSDTAMLGSMDQNKLYQQGFQAQRGHDVAIANDMASASADRSNATMTGISGAIGAAGSILGGVSQMKALQGKTGMFNGGSYGNGGMMGNFG